MIKSNVDLDLFHGKLWRFFFTNYFFYYFFFITPITFFFITPITFFFHQLLLIAVAQSVDSTTPSPGHPSQYPYGSLSVETLMQGLTQAGMVDARMEEETGGGCIITVVSSDAIRKKHLYLKKKTCSLCEKNLASKKKTLKKCFFFFKYSFKRNFKLTVA